MDIWVAISDQNARKLVPGLQIDALPDYADFRYRLVGSSVCEYFLANGTGKTVSEVFKSERVAQPQTFGEPGSVDVHHHVDQRLHFGGFTRFADEAKI